MAAFEAAADSRAEPIAWSVLADSQQEDIKAYLGRDRILRDEADARLEEILTEEMRACASSPPPCDRTDTIDAVQCETLLRGREIPSNNTIAGYLEIIAGHVGKAMESEQVDRARNDLQRRIDRYREQQQVLSREWLEFEGGVISRMFNALTRRANAEGDYAMDQDNTKPAAHATGGTLFDDWFDPIEKEVRTKVRGFIETMIEEELSMVLCRPRYGRHVGSPPEDGKAAPVAGHRHGHRKRSLTGTFGPTEIAVPRARLAGEDGKTTEWKSQSLRAYQRRTQAAEALIASAYLSGTNTRRVRRALAAVFAKGVGKDIVSRTWRKVKGDWDGWNARSLAEEPIVRLILDGTVVRVRLDKKATSISLLVALGVRRDGQKVLLAVKNMGGESEAAWRALLDDLVKRGLKMPDLIIVDGGSGLDAALAALWSDVPVQRCTVHKHRNLLAHAPERLHEELTNNYRDMIYAETAKEVETHRKAFLRKWRLKCPAVATSLEEAGDRLFTFTRFPQSQWKSIRTSNAIERLHEEFKRRIKTQTVLPAAETAAMLFWALMASGQITMRKVDGWKTLAEKPSDQVIDLAA